MTHIEHDSEAWNTQPSTSVRLLASAVEVLRSSLGRFWPFFLTLLVVVMLLPALVFGLLGRVRLDPALFVTEWIHLTIEGMFFFFILEIVRHRSLASTSRESLIAFVSLNYLDPIQDLIASLRQSQEAQPETDTNYIQTLAIAGNAWAIIEHALSDDALNHLPKREALVVWIISNRNALDLQRCAAILQSLNAGNRNHEELRELLQRLEAFRVSAKRLCGKA